MKIKEAKWLGNVIQAFHSALKPYQKTGFVWKIMTDTYRPEYLRYGANALNNAESMFHFDSVAFLGFLDKTSGDEREILRWQYAILSVDTLLEAFEFKLSQKLELMKNLKEVFASEFKFDSEQRKHLAKLFRKHKNEIYISLSVQQPGDKFYQLYLILRQRTESIDPIVKQLKRLDKEGALQVSLVNLLDSYIHMQINRIIPDQARLHEAVIYDFLYHYYKSIMGRENGDNNKNHLVASKTAALP